jgi:hypothetical protein
LAGGDGGRRSPERPLMDGIDVCRLIRRALRIALPVSDWLRGLGSDEQIFGADKQVAGCDLSD